MTTTTLNRKFTPRGLTLIECMLAMFIFMIGIVGVLAALPMGVNSATQVVMQDAAIHLAHSKFSEFRRDRVDPAGLGSAWQDFAHAPGDPYQYFDDIDQYQWMVDPPQSVGAVAAPGTGVAPATNLYDPAIGAGAGVPGLWLIGIHVRKKGNAYREFVFRQYMYGYDN